MSETPGHVDAEFGPGDRLAGPARRQRRRQPADRPQPILDAEAGTGDVVDVPSVVPLRRPTRHADAVDDPVIALGGGHGSEVGQLSAGAGGKEPLFPGAEGALAFERPTDDLACV